jgi:hypothetical protein
MLSPASRSLTEAVVFQTPFRHSPRPNSPSVASVTSVRCFPLRVVLSLKRWCLKPRSATAPVLIPPSVASVTSVRCFPGASFSHGSRRASTASFSMGMSRNFRAAFTNEKVEINSLVRLQDVIKKQSVPSAWWRLRRDPFGLSPSKFFL